MPKHCTLKETLHPKLLKKQGISNIAVPYSTFNIFFIA